MPSSKNDNYRTNFKIRIRLAPYIFRKIFLKSSKTMRDLETSLNLNIAIKNVYGAVPPTFPENLGASLNFHLRPMPGPKPWREELAKTFSSRAHYSILTQKVKRARINFYVNTLNYLVYLNIVFNFIV